MTGLEIFAQRMERRIQKIRENPDPSRINANILFYEAQLEHARYLLEFLKSGGAGEPLLDCSGHCEAVPRAMGFRLLQAIHLADEFGMQTPEEILEEATSLGFPDYVCDRTISYLPAMLHSEMPKPQLVMASEVGCDMVNQARLAYANQLGIPVFPIDIPFEDDSKSNLGYVAGQLKAFIKFAEAKVPGVKYDEDKLAEWIELEAEYYGYWHDVYKLRRQVPCPEHPRDVFRDHQYLATYPNPAKVVQWAKAYRDELREKAARGYTPVGKEKLRVMWTVTGPYNIPVWEHLAKRGVSVVMKYIGMSRRWWGIDRPGWKDTTDYGRKLSPLEEVARDLLDLSWGGTGKKWVEDGLYICRDANIEAIINFDQVNCTPCQGLAKFMAEAAERELGIPTLNLQSRSMFTSMGLTKEELYERIDNFIEMCLQRKSYRS